MKAYADSSFIVALYLQQQSSAIAAALVQELGEALPFIPWHRTEVRNAIRLAVFHKTIEADECRTQLRRIEADLREEFLIIHTPVEGVAVLRLAEKLGATHHESLGCRSSDLFHVAAAMEGGADHFLTFDERQKRIAKAAGLTILN